MWKKHQRHREAAAEAVSLRLQNMGISKRAIDDDIAPRLSVAEVPAGHPVTGPFDRPDFILVNGMGTVKTIVPLPNDIHVAIQYVRPSHIIGIVPMLRKSPPLGFAAVAHTDAVVAGLSRDLMRDVVAMMSGPTRLQLLAYDMRAMSRLLFDACVLLGASVRDALAYSLATLSRDVPSQDHPHTIDAELSLDDLAELVCACRSRLADELRTFHRDRLLSERNGRYVVSPHMLRSGAAVERKEGGGGLPLGDDDTARGRLGHIMTWLRRHLTLSRQPVATLIDGARLHRYEPGMIVAGTDGFYASLLVSGVARVECEVEPGRFIGAWMAKPGHFVAHGWDGGRRGSAVPRFRAVAHETCEVATFDASALARALTECSPEEVLQFLGYCHTALSRQLHDKSVLRSMKVRDRVLHQLRVLARDFPEVHPRGTAIRLRLSQREHVAPRLLARFVAAGEAQFATAFWELVDRQSIDFVDGKILLVGFRVSGVAAA